MHTAFHFETLTKRNVLLQERTETFVSQMTRLLLLLEADIDFEEQRTGIFDVATPNYSIIALQLRARRDNLSATIFRLKGRS
jgi:hypothetical protein